MKRKETQSRSSMLLGELFPEPKESLNTILRDHSFLTGLDDKHLSLLSKIGTQVSLEAGTEVLSELNDCIYLLYRGQIAIEQFVPGRGVVSIDALNPGDALGWGWCIDSATAPHSRARAVESSNLVMFKGADLRAMAIKHPALGYFLAKRTAQLVARQLQATQQFFTEDYDQGD